MISAKDKVIDGARYTVTQMTARQALRMQAKLIKLLGPCMSEALLACMGKNESDGFSRAIMALANSLDERSFDGLMFELLQGVRKEGVELTEGNINLEFAGALNTMYKVIGFVLEANYADFLEEGGIIKMLMSAIKATPPTPAFPSQDSTTQSKTN